MEREVGQRGVEVGRLASKCGCRGVKPRKAPVLRLQGAGSGTSGESSDTGVDAVGNYTWL